MSGHRLVGAVETTIILSSNATMIVTNATMMFGDPDAHLTHELHQQEASFNQWSRDFLRLDAGREEAQISDTVLKQAHAAKRPKTEAKSPVNDGLPHTSNADVPELLIILEIGSGERVPTLRHQSEQLLLDFNMQHQPVAQARVDSYQSRLPRSLRVN